MDDWEEFESWHEDLRAYERFHDELERIKEKNLRGLLDFDDKEFPLHMEISTQPDTERCNNPV